MGWQLLDRPKTHKVTKQLAKQFAEMAAAPHDRPLSERRMMVYRKMLQEGTFRPVTWSCAVCVETGDVYRVNGKHTSTVLAAMEKLPDFYVTVEEYECDTLEDVARLYATFDSKMASRTASDINMSFAATVSELSGIPARVINPAVSGMSYHIWHDRTGHHQAAERAELLMEHPDFVIWLAEMVSSGEGGNSRSICRQPVVAAMFAGWQKSKSAATEFWTAVRDETGPTPDLPSRKIAKYLGATSVKNGTGAAKVKAASIREIYVRCLHAWNAWRKGEQTNLKYYPDADIPTAK